MKAFFLFISLFCFNACHFDMKIIKGDGNVIVEEIDLPAFTSVNVGGNFTVELYQTDNPGIIIETDENLIEYIEVDVTGNQLTVNSEYALKPSEELLVEIYYSDLGTIKSSGTSSIRHEERLKAYELDVDLSGAGSIRLNMDVNELDLNLSGAGMVELEGIANSQVVYLSGAGTLEAKDLQSRYCEIHISGMGNAEVNVLDELNANISGLGNIEYYGNPEEIVQNISGLGKVKSAGKSRREQGEM